MTKCVQELFDSYRNEVTTGVTRSRDDERSYRYYATEMRLLGRPAPRYRPSGRLRHRVVRVWDLDEFVATHGRLPRHSPGAASSPELSLAKWITEQRRADLCAYQINRLDCIEGFVWNPRSQREHEMLSAYIQFVEHHG